MNWNIFKFKKIENMEFFLFFFLLFLLYIHSEVYKTVHFFFWKKCLFSYLKL